MDFISDTQSFLSSGVFNESFDSTEDGATDPWYSLIRNLSNTQFISLSSIFKAKSGSALNKDEFVNAIDKIFGNSKYSLQSILLFEQIDKEENRVINWNQFLDFIIDNWETKSCNKVTLNLKQIFTLPHTKRESIIKIVLVETENYFCYTIISKHGRVGLYDGNMNFLTSYHVIFTREDITRNDEDRRRRNRWVTDAIFCVDVLMLLITNSARSIIIYEASGLKHVPLWLIIGVPNVIQCFTYFSDTEKNILFAGDDIGNILTFNFLQPKIGLLRRKYNDKLSLFYWAELSNEKEYLIIKNIGKVHDDNVRHIEYNSQNNRIITCSRDPDASTVRKHAANKRKTYTFSMRRGTSCFALNKTAKLLITGSDDGTIRFWNTVMTSKPIAILNVHQAGIVDIQVMEEENLFLSYSRDGVFKLWDIKDQKCLQTIKIKYPPFKVLGKLIEWGKNSIYPGPKRLSIYTKSAKNNNDDSSEEEEKQIIHLDKWQRSCILLTCCNYIAQAELKFLEENVQASFEMSVLPPPPLQNSVLVPTTWKIYDDNAEVDEWQPSTEAVDPKIDEYISSLSYILEKDILGETGQNNDINYKIATLEKKKLLMQDSVSKGAPYLALDLHDIEDLQLSPDLPVPNRKRIKDLVEKTHRMLSAASSRDQIFSEPSSSRSRSSRSSVMEFQY